MTQWLYYYVCNEESHFCLLQCPNSENFRFGPQTPCDRPGKSLHKGHPWDIPHSQRSLKGCPMGPGKDHKGRTRWDKTMSLSLVDTFCIRN